MTKQENNGTRFMRGSPAARPILKQLPTFAFFALLLFAIWHLVFDRNGFRKYSNLQSELNDLTTELSNLQAQQAQLTADIEALKNDPDMLEKVAREKYRMHKHGEKVIEIVGEAEKTESR